MKLPKLNFKWFSRKNEGKLEKPTLKTTEVLLNGKLLTCILLSIVSAIIDLVFFSGLSKSKLPIAWFFIPAAVLYTLMSIGFSMGKFFSAMQLGAIAELKTRLRNQGYTWISNLRGLSFKWHIVHKFLIAVSIITSVSLSLLSIGDGVRRNNNEIAKAEKAEIAISRYANTSDKSDDIQFQNLVSSSSASSNAAITAQEQASRIWPIIEEYRQERAEFISYADYNSLEEIDFKGQRIMPSDYWDDRNAKVVADVRPIRAMSLSQIRNISSQQALVSLIRNEIEQSVQNSSSEQLASLSEQTREKAREEIRNLKGRFTTPDGEVVEFDENNISDALNKLSDLKAAWLNDGGDVGASAKMFMLIGPTLDKLLQNKNQTLEDVAANTSISTFGGAQILMMILICIFGIVQEFLIALFTPKSVISRKMMYQFEAYFGPDLDIDKFLLSVYIDYYKKGVINQKDFDAKSKKCVESIDITINSIVNKYSKKPKPEKQYSAKVDDAVKEIEEILK